MWSPYNRPEKAGARQMGNFCMRATLILFGLSCVGTEAWGTYEFLWAKFHEWNYLVVGGILVTSLAAVLPIAAEYARRHGMRVLAAVGWLAVPLTLIWSSLTDTSTPAGMATGIFPTRDISVTPRCLGQAT